jgi:zinc-finger of a C2HC-type
MDPQQTKRKEPEDFGPDLVPCEHCKKKFDPRGLGRHERACEEIAYALKHGGNSVPQPCKTHFRSLSSMLTFQFQPLDDLLDRRQAVLI